MKNNKRIIFCVLTAVLLVNCKQQAPKTAEEEPRLIKTMVISEGNLGLMRTYPGRVSAGEKVDLSFLVSGPLVSLPIKEGMKVQKGQVLAKIDSEEYDILAAQEKAKYELAKITFKRYSQLLPTEAISKSQYDEKKSLFELAKAQYDQALKSVGDTTITAPFSGVIAKRYVENYQYVQAKQNIVSLQDYSDLEIIVNVPEQDMSRARSAKRSTENGKEVVGNASFSTIPNTTFPVVVKEVSTYADPQTQTYQVVFRMPLPKNLIILPGMTANVTINFSSLGNEGNYIPADAVEYDTQGKAFVWIVDAKDMTVTKNSVEVGGLRDNKINVLSGIKSGQTLVIAGGAYLHQGMKVKFIEGRIGR